MEKRIVALFSAVCILLGALLWRTMEVGRRQETQALQRAHTRVLAVGTSRGVIYDRNLQPLAPSDERLVAAVAPCEAAMQTMTALFGKDTAQQMLLRGAPCLANAETAAETPFVRTFSVPVRRGDSALAAHLIGTLNSESHGTCGIEKTFDTLLNGFGGSLSVRFAVDATGRVLPGEAKEIIDSNFKSKGGVALTIDTELQRITEAALQNSRIQSGCAVIMDVQTGEIRAMASVPLFDTDAANPSLSPFTNKALGAYSVGSVFKPLLAAFALEHGVKRSFSYTCTGTCRIGETQFQCFGQKAHGKQTMKEALENSCNTYFIRLMQEIDETAFLSFCETLGFSRAIALCDGLSCSKGSLPSARDLLLPGERANFAFGQGKLLASPVQLLSIYQLLATGLQTPPTVLYGIVDEHGALQRETPFAPVRRLKETTVRQMQTLLAASAKAADTVGAGKTGTAQSGIFEAEKEVCRTWFAGFFPEKAPRYAAVILNENGVSGAADCAPVFGEICRSLP